MEDLDEKIVEAISSVVSQYINETGTKNKNTIINFSSFAYYFVVKLIESKKQLELIKNEKDINVLYDIAKKRKDIFERNIDIYEQLEHLIEMGTPDYVLEDIIESIEYLFSNFIIDNEIESKDFYSRFGENLCLDLQNFAILDLKNKK